MSSCLAVYRPLCACHVDSTRRAVCRCGWRRCDWRRLSHRKRMRSSRIARCWSWLRLIGHPFPVFRMAPPCHVLVPARRHGHSLAHWTVHSDVTACGRIWRRHHSRLRNCVAPFRVHCFNMPRILEVCLLGIALVLQPTDGTHCAPPSLNAQHLPPTRFVLHLISNRCALPCPCGVAVRLAYATHRCKW